MASRVGIPSIPKVKTHRAQKPREPSNLLNPKDHWTYWTLKTSYFEDPTPAIQVHSPFHWRVQDP